MKNGFDRWAKKLAMRGPASPAEPATSSDGVTRRDVMKKAGLVGAVAVWATPVIQSVAAPAFAQSGGGTCTPSDVGANCGGTCTTKCGATRTCTAPGDCLSGTCTSGHCAQSGVGGSCVAAADCTTNSCSAGVCIPNPPGSSCNDGSDCTTNRCTAGICTTSPPGGQCNAASDCLTGQPCVNHICT